MVKRRMNKQIKPMNWFNMNPPKITNFGSFMQPASAPLFQMSAPPFMSKNASLAAIKIPQRMESNRWLPMIQTPKKSVGFFWGDKDNDGVYNGLDCEPRNERKQGNIHRKEKIEIPEKTKRPLLSKKFIISSSLKRAGRYTPIYTGGKIDRGQTKLSPSIRYQKDIESFEKAYNILKAHEMVKDVYKDKKKAPSRDLYDKEIRYMKKQIQGKEDEYNKGLQIAKIKGAEEERNFSAVDDNSWGNDRMRLDATWRPVAPGTKFRKTEDDIRKLSAEWRQPKEENKEIENKEIEYENTPNNTINNVKEEILLKNELDDERQKEEKEKQDKRILDRLHKDINFAGEDEFSEEDITDD